MVNNPAEAGIFSQEAEEAVIGAVLIDPVSFSILHARLSAGDFFILRHRMVWEALERLHKRGMKADFITVQDELRAGGKLAEIGGATFILGLINNTPTAANAETYAELVKRASVRRQLVAASDTIRALAADATISTDEALDQASEQLSKVSSLTVSGFVSMATLADEHMDVMERAMENPGVLAGIPSVIPGIGKAIGGYQPGETYLVGARPSMGKTSFLLSEALHMAQRGKVVAIASLEMTKRRLTSALAGMLSDVPSKTIDEGGMSREQYSAYVGAMGQLSRLPIFIEDDPEMTPRQLIGKLRKLKFERGLDVVMVDYVQLMEPTNTGRRYESETAEVAAVSKALVRIAKLLNVPMLAAAQLNREVESRADKHPQMSDLKQTGQLEQDATAIFFPFRPAFYEQNDGPPPRYEEVEIAIAKNRYGPTGIVRCAFMPVLKRFVPTEPKNLNDMIEEKAS